MTAMCGVLRLGSTTARLDQAWEASPPHLRPVIAAVRDHRMAAMFAPPGEVPFRRPRGDSRPVLYVLQDDFDRSVGPEAFHGPSVRRAIRESAAFAVVACAPMPDVYAGLVAVALAAGRAMIVETQPENEIPWVSLIRKLAPGRPLIWATMKGGRA